MASDDRRLSKDICLTLIKHLRSRQSKRTADTIVVDLKRLQTWLSSNPEITETETEADVLDSAIGYNNFCMDVVRIDTRGTAP